MKWTCHGQQHGPHPWRNTVLSCLFLSFVYLFKLTITFQLHSVFSDFTVHAWHVVTLYVLLSRPARILVSLTCFVWLSVKVREHVLLTGDSVGCRDADISAALKLQVLLLTEHEYPCFRLRIFCWRSPGRPNSAVAYQKSFPRSVLKKAPTLLQLQLLQYEDLLLHAL